MNSGNPCKAILFCPSNSLYVKYITGSVIEEKYCKINSFICFKCVKCSFTFNGMNFTSTSFDHRYSACGEVDPDLCNTGTECLQNGGTGQSLSNAINKILHSEGLLNNLILKDYKIRQDKLYITADVYNIMGQLVIRSLNLKGSPNLFYSEDLDKLPYGIYYFILESEDGPKTIKWIK